MQPTTINNTSKNYHSERVAFIQACWHKDIVDQSRKGFLTEMIALGHQESNIDFFEVSGAFEIPLHAKILAKTNSYAGIVAAALIVDGGIYRHEFVAQSVVGGLMQVQLETEVPVFSVSLTPHHFHASSEHHKFFYEHFVYKGQEAARTCTETLQKMRAIQRYHDSRVTVV
ncbi:6,7-dimethyl-8-ribityllumazine synthase [Candidatus Pseudomonas adelgestsugas]|uniref:6,7-dimethyl-8-ribityllumazine synthase n=1 Tax=Candidatus Pseudomonas adelgestsugas TaxID=1302376 RepID=A0ABX5RA53_9PSED|nr:6,7-dimethyl-8-ribityllumazine synthase [Candidatus Pseudomonas adelgestsugas]QAX82199.1 6,7-dimethyl-8-ribityllumazine synthase 2 [Candidatus Pseudomonas adelgestsugas]